MRPKLAHVAAGAASALSRHRSRLASGSAQALVEYTLILALIAIAALAALTQLGSGIVETLEEITTAL